VRILHLETRIPRLPRILGLEMCLEIGQSCDPTLRFHLPDTSLLIKVLGRGYGLLYAPAVSQTRRELVERFIIQSLI